MLVFFVFFGVLVGAAIGHSAYLAGVEAGEERALVNIKREVFLAARAECARAEASRQELSGSYRMVQRLVTGLSKGMP